MKFIRHLAIPAGWLFLICALYAIPGIDIQYEDPWDVLTIDKFVHAGMFMILVSTLIVFFRKQSHIRTFYVRPRSWALGIAIFFGLILELVQGMLFVMRTSDTMDFLANVTGAFAGLFFFRMVYGRPLSNF